MQGMITSLFKFKFRLSSPQADNQLAEKILKHIQTGLSRLIVSLIYDKTCVQFFQAAGQSKYYGIVESRAIY